MNIEDFLERSIKQDAERLRTCFSDSAYINRHCTNEHFTVKEYIHANCEYLGTWDGTIERIEQIDDLLSPLSPYTDTENIYNLIVVDIKIPRLSPPYTKASLGCKTNS